jgi:preprotein translocase subunit YajC
MGQAGVCFAHPALFFTQYSRGSYPMSLDIHGFVVSADALHQATATGMAFAAQESAATPVAGSADVKAAGSGNELQQTIMFIGLMLVMMYFIVLRPQRREKQERQKRLDGMKKGDRIISIGGIHGKITDVDQTQNVVSVEVAPKLVIKFSKTAIQVVTPKGEENAKDSKEAPKQDSDSAQAE